MFYRAKLTLNTWYLWAKKKVKFLKMICLTPELVTALFCPTPRSRENLNVNGAVEKNLEQKVVQKKHEKN